MYKETRRKDRAIDNEAARALLNDGMYGVLSTTDEHNQPYGIPLNYAVMDGEIFIHSADEGHKLDNIKSNRKVSFCVVGKTELLPEKFSTQYESVVVFGTASIIKGDKKRAPLITLLEKYAPDHMESGREYIDKLINKTVVIKVSVDHITGKARK